jgi:D-beta-D-heptose 7-phosphate kinase/D-beta-D-heptose 1-phosphate adenosyltransferase
MNPSQTPKPQAKAPDWQRLCEILESCGNRQILVLGDFMIDRYVYGDAERISPEAPVPILRVVRQEDALGGAGSVVADILALGAKAVCVGVTGDDIDGRLLSDKLEQVGADSSGLLAVKNRPTTRKTRLVGLAQHRHRQQLIRIDDESTDAIDSDTVDQLINRLDLHLPLCQILCIEDYNKGVITTALAARAIELAHKRRIPVFVDPASIDNYSRYAGADVITPNRTETERVAGMRLPDIDAVRQNAAKILQSCRTKYVCVTLDREGAALIGPNGAFQHIPTKSRDVYDVTGAGDEVLATLAVAVAAGAALPQAVALANVAGGLEVEKFGCVPISRDEVIGEILLEHHKHLGKIRTLEQLLPELARRRSRKETIAFTNGCFDLLHAGHVATFEFAKKHAHILIVGVNSDASVSALDKGEGRPIVAQSGRATVLAALQDIDYVVIFDSQTPQSLIEKISPDVLIKGRDWEGKIVAGQAHVEKNGGRVLFAPLVEGHSTTSIIHRIRNA